MYCNYCGAVVVGKYCSCCGKRLLSRMEHFRRTERKRCKDFADKAYRDSGKDVARQHLANACWVACTCKYGDYLDSKEESYLAIDAYEKLALVESHAVALYERIKAEGF